MSRLVLLSLALLASGCANDHSTRNTLGLKPSTKIQNSAVDLKDKSIQEVFELKYDQAELFCQLWTQYAPEFIRQQNPDIVLKIDLKSGVLQDRAAQTWTIRYGQEELIFTFQVDEIKIHSMHLVDFSDGNEYKMTYSPRTEVFYTYEAYRILEGQQSSLKEKGNGSRDILENRNTTILEEKQLDGDKAQSYFKHFECVIKTAIKPEYQDQFQILHP